MTESYYKPGGDREEGARVLRRHGASEEEIQAFMDGAEDSDQEGTPPVEGQQSDRMIRHIAAKHGMPIPEDYVVRSEEPEDEATRDLTSEEVWKRAREIAAGLPGLMPPGPIEGGFLGNPP